MKKNSGFTLIEIIISLALLGLISVVLLSNNVLQFRLIKNTQNITQDVFTAQQDIENTITRVKKEVQDNTISETSTSYTLFSGENKRTVEGYPEKVDISSGSTSRTLFTVIANNSMPEYKVASATVTIKFSNGNLIAYKDAPLLSVKSDITLTDPSNVNLTNIYRWYISRPGFNIPMVKNSIEIEKGTMFPIFPDDYTIIPGASKSTLTSILPGYAGRHLVCTVTPASKSGKMGETAVSNPVFLSGLPVIQDLKLHLDAAMISRESVTDISISGNKSYVKRWPSISDLGNNSSQTTSNKQPELIECKIGDFDYNKIKYETYAKYVEFDGIDDYITGNISSLDEDKKTVFIVAKNTVSQNFTIYKDVYDSTIFSINNKNFNIGYNGTNDYSKIDVAEVLVYNKVLSQDDSNLVINYLKNKYQATEAVVNIKNIDDIAVTVEKGSTYTLPTSVIANLSDGTKGDVEITWSQNSVNTNSLGETKITGTANIDNTKTMTLTVTVIQGTVVEGPKALEITDCSYNFYKGFDITFDKDIQSASIDVNNVGIMYKFNTNKKIILFLKNYNNSFTDNTNITVEVTSTDGSESTIVVKRNGVDWEIVSQ
ncbi:MAG: Ig-like domain-containing protein [Clostridiaceae bacterium]